jgi:Ca-activated chloride channel homolog
MPTSGLSDHQLLREYVEKGSEDAFRLLVRRHSSTVYSACSRALGDAHLAEDAAQATFVVLARKAGKVKEKVMLSDWLHKTAQYITADLRRGRARRARRERIAAERATGQSSAQELSPDAAWLEVRPHLDDALVTLPAGSRKAVIQHYLEGRSREEVARRMGCSVDAVRMRLKYGIDMLREKLLRRKVTVSAAVLALLLAERSSEVAPGGLSAAIEAAALWTPAAATVAPASVAIAQGAIELMFWAKVKTVAASLAAAALLAGAVTGITTGAWPSGEARAADSRESRGSKPQSQNPTTPKTKPATLERLAAAPRSSAAAKAVLKPTAKASPAAKQPVGLLSPTQQVTHGALRFGKDGRFLDCPLRHTDVKVAISGFIARVTVVQRFKNPTRQKIEAVYAFPLPHSSAVDRMNIVVGDRRIVGVIKRREVARTIYRKAVVAGKVAALLEQERPNLFTQSIGNIPPGGEVLVEISYVDVLEYDAGGYAFHFPMIVGPRYNPPGWKDPVCSGPTPAQIKAGYRPGHDISLWLSLDAGVAVDDIKSVNHKIELTQTGESTANCSIAAGDRIPNKDFDLRYKVAGERPRVALLAHAASGEDGYFMLVAQPGAKATEFKVPPREVIFLVDISGSMEGDPLARAKELMAASLRKLQPGDTLQVIAFSNAPAKCFTKPVPCSAANLARAGKFVAGLTAGGGTEMLSGVKAVLSQKADPARVRVAVMLTDGGVGNEAQIVREVARRCNDAVRFWCVGIGTSPNRHLLTGVSKAGGGMSKVLSTNASAGDTAELVDSMMNRIHRAQIAGVEIEWGGLEVYDTYPARIPELWAGRPVVVYGRYSGGGSARIRLRGSAEGRAVSIPLNVKLPGKCKANDVLATVWARRKIADLMHRVRVEESPEVVEEVTRFALEHRLMTRYTSFVAVDQEQKPSSPPSPASKPETRPRRTPVNVPLPTSSCPTIVVGASEAVLNATVVNGRLKLRKRTIAGVSPRPLARPRVADVPPSFPGGCQSATGFLQTAKGYASAPRARLHLSTAKRLFEGRMYADARWEAELAVQSDPGNAQAQRLLRLVNSVLAVRRSRIRTMTQHLQRREHIKRQEQLMKLGDHVKRAKQLMARAGTGKALSDADRKRLEQAERELLRAQEISKWMPAYVPVTEMQKDIATQLARLKKRRQGRLENQLSSWNTKESNTSSPTGIGRSTRLLGRSREELFFHRKIAAMVTRARFDYNGGRYQEAQAICEQILRLDPTNAEAVELRTRSRVRAIDKRAAGKDNLTNEAIKDWVELSKRATIPHSRVLVYPENWEGTSRREPTVEMHGTMRHIEGATIPHSSVLTHPDNWARVVLQTKELGMSHSDMTAELGKLETSLDKLETSLDKHESDRKRLAEELANAEYVIATLKKKGYDLYKITGVKKGYNLDKITGVKSRSSRPGGRMSKKELKARLANAEYVIATTIKKGYDVYKIVGPGALGAVPDVRTKVVDVRPKTGHVALGVGKDSGVKEGFIFLIHRGDEYIGKVRVTTVWKDFSGGTIIERKKPIKAGDDAMTDTTPDESGGTLAPRPRKVDLGLESPRRRGAVVLEATARALRADALPGARADNSRVRGFIGAAKVFARHGKLDEARARLQLAFLSDSARASLGISRGKLARAALSQLLEIEEQLARQHLASEPRLRTRLDVVIRRCSMSGALKRVVGASRLRLTIARGALKDAAALAGGREPRVTYWDARGLTVAEALDRLCAGAQLQWSATRGRVTVTSGRRLRIASPWTYDVGVLALPDISELAGDARARDAVAAAGAEARAFAAEVRKAARLELREYCFWLAPGKLVVYADARGHARVTRLLARLERGSGSGALPAKVRRRAKSRRVMLERLRKEREKRAAAHVRNLLRSVPPKLLFRAAAGRRDARALVLLQDAVGEGLPGELYREKYPLVLLRAAWMISENALTIGAGGDRSRELARTVLQGIELPAANAMKSLEKVKSPQTRMTALYAALALRNARDLLGVRPGRFERYRRRLLAITRQPRGGKSAGIDLLTQALLADKPGDELGARLLARQELLSDADGALLMALAARRIGGRTWLGFRELSWKKFRQYRVPADVALLVGRLGKPLLPSARR